MAEAEAGAAGEGEGDDDDMEAARRSGRRPGMAEWWWGWPRREVRMDSRHLLFLLGRTTAGSPCPGEVWAGGVAKLMMGLEIDQA